MRAVIFDVDDTLYHEAMFVRGGFLAVGRELEQRGVGEAEQARDVFWEIHDGEGRDRVFNKAAARLGFDEAWIPELVKTYRGHAPTLSFFEEVPELLGVLKENYRLGCVTDGWLETQQNKVAALGLEAMVHAVVYSDEFGRAYWKPHARPFHACCERLGVRPEDAIFVGDNPERDIAGARNAGLMSVRLRRPEAYFATDSSEAADFEIQNLRELPALLSEAFS